MDLLDIMLLTVTSTMKNAIELGIYVSEIWVICPKNKISDFFTLTSTEDFIRFFFPTEKQTTSNKETTQTSLF